MDDFFYSERKRENMGPEINNYVIRCLNNVVFITFHGFKIFQDKQTKER